MYAGYHIQDQVPSNTNLDTSASVKVFHLEVVPELGSVDLSYEVRYPRTVPVPGRTRTEISNLQISLSAFSSRYVGL